MADNNPLLAALLRILRALIRVLLRHGVPYPVFSEFARWTYVDVAAKEFPIEGRKQTNSRVSVLTGLSRKEVLRLRDLPPPTGEVDVEQFHRAARIVSAWTREADYCEPGGAPQPVPFEGPGASFSDLVRRFGGDVPPRAVLDELLRVGTVERDGGDHLRLRTRAYLPVGAGAEAERLAILGTDVAALVETIDHNLQREPGARWFQRKVAYRGVPAADLTGTRALAAAEGQRVLELLDRVLAEHVQRGTDEGGQDDTRQVMLGIYWHEREPEGAAPPPGGKRPHSTGREEAP